MIYDVLIIGHDPVGLKAGLQAARRNLHVAVAGVSPHWEGTPLPLLTTLSSGWFSDALRELLDGHREFPSGVDPRRQVLQSVQRNWRQLNRVLDEYSITRFSGHGRFTSAHQFDVRLPGGIQRVQARKFLVATGTRPYRPPRFPWDGQQILDTDELFQTVRIPESVIVVGGGLWGGMISALLSRGGSEVFWISSHAPSPHEFPLGVMQDVESGRIKLILRGDVIGVQRQQSCVEAILESGERLRAEKMIAAVGRVGCTESLGLDTLGVNVDDHGRLWCDQQGRTWAPHVLAAGDVIGFPPERRTELPALIEALPVQTSQALSAPHRKRVRTTNSKSSG